LRQVLFGSTGAMWRGTWEGGEIGSKREWRGAGRRLGGADISLAGARQVPGRCQADARQMPGKCQASARQVPGKSHAHAMQIRGIFRPTLFLDGGGERQPGFVGAEIYELGTVPGLSPYLSRENTPPGKKTKHPPPARLPPLSIANQQLPANNSLPLSPPSHAPALPPTLQLPA